MVLGARLGATAGLRPRESYEGEKTAGLRPRESCEGELEDVSGSRYLTPKALTGLGLLGDHQPRGPLKLVKRA